MARQSDLRYTFAPLASEAQFEVVSFKLKEGLSRPFHLKLTLSSRDPDIDFAGLLDSRVLFTLWHQQVGNSHHETTGGDHHLEVGGHFEQLIAGSRYLVVGQGARVDTTMYQLQASERLVMSNPGGSITINATGVHFEGVAIHVKGPLNLGARGQGQDLHIQLPVNLAEPCKVKA
ncbi:hypothetical protein SFA35_18230 [Pseudomonas sp. HR96]|uniref:hypothetical protein n=1 Tax=Pseudomonas sp. HR96 TaxID=1027966 RepID=UPI002A759BFF|nr:hypothetical protein [Pseudomonas sp. HR96]WPO98558.1 hypothetical protein SFA35_18230 [Pseudomonas sp. HR96]